MDFIDESEVLTPADDQFHIDKHAFTVPFVCGARNLDEALRRSAEGAAMILAGGGSATIGRPLRRFELDLPIVDRIARGMSTFGTCEGLILMAKMVISGGPPPWPGWT